MKLAGGQAGGNDLTIEENTFDANDHGILLEDTGETVNATIEDNTFEGESSETDSYIAVEHMAAVDGVDDLDDLADEQTSFDPAATSAVDIVFSGTAFGDVLVIDDDVEENIQIDELDVTDDPEERGDTATVDVNVTLDPGGNFGTEELDSERTYELALTVETVEGVNDFGTDELATEEVDLLPGETQTNIELSGDLNGSTVAVAADSDERNVDLSVEIEAVEFDDSDDAEEEIQVVNPIENAIDTAGADETVQAVEGEFGEQVIVEESVTIESLGDTEKTVITNADNSQETVSILAGDVELDGFTINNTADGASGAVQALAVRADNGATETVELRNLVLDGSDLDVQNGEEDVGFGLYVRDGGSGTLGDSGDVSDVTVENVDVSDFDVGVGVAALEGNEISDVTFDDVDVTGSEDFDLSISSADFFDQGEEGTITDLTGDDEFDTVFTDDEIQTAVDLTAEDGTATVDDGEYEESVTVDVDGLTLEAAEDANPTVSQDSGTVITVDEDDVTIDGLEIEQEDADDGVGVALADESVTEDATFTLENNEFTSGDTLVDIQQTDMSGADVTIADNDFDVTGLDDEDAADVDYIVDNSEEVGIDDFTAENSDNTYDPDEVFEDRPDEDALTTNEIANWNHLDNVRHAENTEYVLVDDLDDGTDGYSDVVEDGGFEPIPTFDGEFDGNDNTIADLEINVDGNLAGLFTTIDEGGEVTDLTIDADVEADGQEVGALAGNNNGDIKGVSAEGTVDAQFFAGGLVGFNNGGTIEDSSASVDVSGEFAIGGLAGRNAGTVSDSNAAGTVELTGDFGNAGGLVGDTAGGEIIQSFATGDVTDSEQLRNDLDGSETLDAGGLVGEHDDGLIQESFATGDVDIGGQRVGGLIGYIGGAAEDPVVEDSYALGDVAGNTIVGGFIGNADDGEIKRSFSAGTFVEDVQKDVSNADDAPFNARGSPQDIDDDSTYADIPSFFDGPPDNDDIEFMDGTPLGEEGDTPPADEMTGDDADTNMDELDFTDTWDTVDDDYPVLQAIDEQEQLDAR